MNPNFSSTSTPNDPTRLTHDPRKIKNPSPIRPKKLDDDHAGIEYPSFGESVPSEKPEKASGIRYRHPNVESFAQNTGSYLDSTKEGSFLAQNIPSSKQVNASKLGFGDLSRSQRRLHYENNQCSESLDLKYFARTNDNQRPPAHKNINKEKAWQEWWTEKKKNNYLLLEASKLGNIEICKDLLDKSKGDLRGDVNTKGDNGWTPFHFACLSGNMSLVKLLLNHEADIEVETTLKFNSLHIAAQKGYTEIAQMMIELGIDMNARDMFNNTPLHYAAQNGHRDTVRLLLSRPSTDLTVRNNDKKLACELVNPKDKELKKFFDMFMSEKNLLSAKVPSKSTKKLTTAQKLFAPTHISQFNNVAPPRNSTRGNISARNLTSRNESSEKRMFSYRSNITGDTKANSSLNSIESDNGNDEKIGPHSFRVLGMIGKGSFGEVYLVQKKGTEIQYAMKVLHKSKITKHNLINYAMTERNVLGLTNHPFIVKLNYAFQTPEKLFLILDYCPGGDLGEHLQREKKFSEEKARFYIAEVLLALEDLHKRDIIFRDLKPDNIVIDTDGHAKLTDFGLSKEGVLEHAQGAGSFCGSVAYLAPEMLKRTGHGKAVDWYLLGVVFYEMLVGMPPYYTNNREELFHNIENAPLRVPSSLSPDAKSLLKGLLQKNPIKRLGSGKKDAEEIKAHPFFKNIDWKLAEKRKLTPPIYDKREKMMMSVRYDVFDMDPAMQEDTDKINGWSFVAAQKTEPNLDKRLF